MGMAQGVYHVYNMAKARCLAALFENYPNSLTTLDISRITGMDFYKVSRLMNHYFNSPSHYIRRLKVKDGCFFRYKINKKGANYLTEYVKRVKLGVDLNLKSKRPVYMSTYQGHKSVRIRSANDLKLSPEQLAPYIRLNRRGEHELGVKYEDRLKIVGIIKEDKEEGKVSSLPDLPEKLLKSVTQKRRGRPPKKQKKERVKPVKKEIKVYFVPQAVSIRLEPFANKYVPEMPELPKKPLEPAVQNTKDKHSTAQEKAIKKSVKKERKEAGKEKTGEYVFVDLAEETLEYPEKVYNISNEDISSRELAEIVVNILNKLNREIQTTYDKFKVNALQDKKRYYIMYTMNEDIKQFIDIKNKV